MKVIRNPDLRPHGEVLAVTMSSVTVKIYSVTDKKSGYRFFQVADFSSGRLVLGGPKSRRSVQ